MKEGITKKHSQILYGVAILLMLYHHLFCLPERLHCEYYSVLGYMELKLAWFGKMCVAIFAFISGYAAGVFSEKRKNKDEKVIFTFVYDFKYSMKRIFILLKKLVFVFVIFIPLGILLGRITFDWRIFVKGLFQGLFIYNGEWWYVFQYLLLMLAFPFIDVIVSRLQKQFQKYRKRVVFISVVFVLGIIMSCLCFDMAKTLVWGCVNRLYYNAKYVYLIIFLIGYLCAKFNLLQFEVRRHKNKWLPLAGILLISGSFLIRTILAKNVYYIFADIFIVVPFVLGVCMLSECMPKMTLVLQRIGKHSTYMWLTHSFYCYYYFREFITFSRISTIMLIQLFVVSLATAVVLLKTEKLLDMGLFKSWCKIKEVSQKRLL